jgi:hypothetical protein
MTDGERGDALAGIVTLNITVILDEEGNWFVSSTESGQAASDYEKEIGDHGCARRIVNLALRIPMPKPVELTADIPAEPDAGELKVA